MAERVRPAALEARDQLADGRKFSPSAARNRDVIKAVFEAQMPTSGAILEIASGTGEHGAHIIENWPELSWTYSDIDPSGLDSQRSWIAHMNTPRLRGPIELDTRSEHWGGAETEAPWQGIYCANMIHIAPMAAVEGLFRGAGRVLASNALLMLYGPFAQSGQIAPSNAAFDDSLKRRNCDWGVRDLEVQLQPLATRAGLALAALIEMPANNHVALFQRV